MGGSSANAMAKAEVFGSSRHRWIDFENGELRANSASASSLPPLLHRAIAVTQSKKKVSLPRLNHWMESYSDNQDHTSGLEKHEGYPDYVLCFPSRAWR